MTSLKSKLVPIRCLIQRHLLWVCNLVPTDLFDDDFVMPVHDNNVYSDDKNEDVMFDTVNIPIND